MTKLSVNVNKLATLRNSRGKNNPDVVQKSLEIVSLGGQGITVHPRPDERHIRRADVYALKKALDPKVEFNIEGYPSDDFIKMVIEVKPAQVTLVPDPPDALTSNAGWMVRAAEQVLRKSAQQLSRAGIRTSVFVDPTTTHETDYNLLKALGVDRVELYTERFAEAFGHSTSDAVTADYKQAATLAKRAGLGVNAGHDLTSENLTKLIEAIPWIDEVSIGHALICEALDLGLKETIRRYLAAIEAGARKAGRS